MSYLTNLLSSTTSRYTSFRRNLLSSSSEDDSSVDDPELSHVSRVLRAYYTEKGRPFPAWLGTDPRTTAQAQQPQQSFVGSAQGSFKGQSYPSTGGASSSGGGGLGDLWADNPGGGRPPEEAGSLRRGFRPRPGMRGEPQPQSQGGEGLNVRQLPSQRAGSYQTQGQGFGQSQPPQVPGRNMSPAPPSSAGSGSVQERLKARLGGSRSSATPSPPLSGYERMGGPGGGEERYDGRGSTGNNPYGGSSTGGNEGYDWGGRGGSGAGWSGQGYNGGGGGGGGGGGRRDGSGYGRGPPGGQR